MVNFDELPTYVRSEERERERRKRKSEERERRFKANVQKRINEVKYLESR